MAALEHLERYVRHTLAPWCGQSTRKYGLEGRIKSVESIAEKLCTGRAARWGDLDDLVAFTVIVPTRSHEPVVLSKLGTAFRTTETRGRGTTRKRPEVFRFDATRWYGVVRDEPWPPELPESVCNAVFEVQIQTAFENAWSTVTHDLVYKGSGVDWQRRRLAAQLKAVVEQLDDLLIDAFESAATGIPESLDDESEAHAAILDVFHALERDDLLGVDVVPQSWQRFAECVYSLARNRARRASEAASLAKELSADFDRAVRNGEFTIASSGVLFQAVVAFAISRWEAHALRGFPVLWDDDIAALYAVDPPPDVIDLE
ncbi:MAG: hypothetical protein M3N47_00785 [Chloroflexota bacterium]|nr:hypothetical protein [Chloroflexota bacterium]